MALTDYQKFVAVTSTPDRKEARKVTQISDLRVGNDSVTALALYECSALDVATAEKMSSGDC